MKEIRESGVIDWLLLVLRRRTGIRIEGDSMMPALSDGDRVLVDPHAAPSVGDIVIAYHPYKKDVSIVKRIVDILPDGRFVLLGDNLDGSNDSREFGSIAGKDIYGKVVARIR